MALKIYNTLTREKEPFEPLVPDRVNMYVCGPTVYDSPHIGHAKASVSFDIVVRYLRHLGYDVLYVQNITDVGHLTDEGDDGEDKIELRARQRRVEPMQLVETYTREYFKAMDALNCLRPDISPRASGHIPEILELIQRLIESGCAYEAGGSVYFDVSSYPEYGKLSNRRLEEQEAGARVEIAAGKRDPADFALWKRADPGHIMRWNTPWGPGFPGWHIECSAMSMKYLGATLDIHGAGVDNVFPHNEDEIAQSECATHQPFVRYWMHNGSLMINGVKMSKSLGNFLTVEEAIEQYGAARLRYFLLSSHYRSRQDFSPEAIESSGRALEGLQPRQRWRRAGGGAGRSARRTSARLSGRHGRRLQLPGRAGGDESAQRHHESGHRRRTPGGRRPHRCRYPGDAGGTAGDGGHSGPGPAPERRRCGG